MNIESIILALLNAATLILVALINTSNRRIQKRDEERYQTRLIHERLSMELAQCNARLSILMARKMAGEYINGELAEAMANIEKAYINYFNFLNDQISQQVTSRD